jgi:uncharacterized protein YfaS (alpha-2-macroglobulin family)
MNPRRVGLSFCAALLLATSAQAFRVDRFTPQGEVARVNQAHARFSEDMVPFGAQDLPAPFEVDCPQRGTGRWLNAREWIYQFERDLAPGTDCRFRLKEGLHALAGSRVEGRGGFAFNTGGPAIARSIPWSGARIEEEQPFVLVLTGPAVRETVLANAWCQVQGVADRVPIAFVSAADRATLLDHLQLRAAAERTVVARCKQRLPAGAKMTFVWGTGIEALRDGKPTGIVTRSVQRVQYTVRPEFRATLQCTRENAKAACAPVAPLRLLFTTPVARTMAEGIVLRTPQGLRRPYFASDDRDVVVHEVRFKGPFPGLSEVTIELPADFADADARRLVNAEAFPLRVALADLPPLLKFPAATFGIVELAQDAALPVTLRHVEPAFTPGEGALPANAGEIRVLKLADERAVIEWMARLERYDERTIREGRKEIQTREVSLLADVAGARRLTVPLLRAAAADEAAGRSPFEVIGIPLPEPGYYVLEAASRRLGAALLGKDEPMYVRTSALVTNIAVHPKIGQARSVIWVTSLDRGRPLGGVDVRIVDCHGREVWRGTSGKDGVAAVERELGEAPYCSRGRRWLVSARAERAEGGIDFSFAWSDWTDGIEPWRFDIATAWDHRPVLRAHTVLDRPLYRAGETVSMKHFLRRETASGLALLEAKQLPAQAKLRHLGSGDEFVVPIEWDGARSGRSSLRLPTAAKKGRYLISLGEWQAGSFRVEDFRLPVFTGSLSASQGSGIDAAEFPLAVQVSFLAGGNAAGLPVRVSAMLQNRYPYFPAYRGFSFSTGRRDDALEQKVVADKLALKLDARGGGRVTITGLPRTPHSYDLVAEATFDDPNGETQTLSRRFPLWPSGVVVGLKTDGWISVSKRAALQAVVLSTDGAPQAGRTIEVKGRLRVTRSHRKRVIGGFYAYEHHTETKDLGVLCNARTDARGLAFCEIPLDTPGEVELVAVTKDAEGRPAQAVASVWVTRHGELWFDVESHDRMDVIPEKRAYRPGETARFQVRMPFREATALVAVEREGVIETHTQTLSGRDPTVEVKIRDDWAPNVYVSVLAVRGRIREVPWTSFFSWGWRSPLEWWRALRTERPEYRPPTALVDLSKPAFRFGIAEIEVGTEANQLEVTVSPERAVYAPRQLARVKVKVTLPGGAAAPPGTEVAVAAVDQALLDLEPNRSWDLLKAMLQHRSYGVVTASAQMQVIGKRHFGRKAIPPGGGGGNAPTRELFDTLLLWKPRVALDARGEAWVEVPLNDSLSTFTVAAIADAGTQRFGSGQGRLRSNLDLQLISGLPPLVREGDRFSALITLRNTTPKPMTVAVSAKLSNAVDAELAPQRVALEAQASTEIVWPVAVPADAAQAGALDWEIEARAENGGPSDRLKLSQRVVPAVPLGVRQAMLAQLAGPTKPLDLRVAPPADAERDADGRARGGIAVSMQARLGGELPGVRRWFEHYPFTCLEQKTSKAIGLRSVELWRATMEALPVYLDRDGLAAYFPLGEASPALGSDVLTAYLLSAAHAAGPEYEIPQASRERMLKGLTAFVEGRIQRKHWSPRRDLDVRKLAALEALSRYETLPARLLTSIAIQPNLWPTSAVIDWLAVLKRTPAAAQRAQRIDAAQNILRARLSYQGTRLLFSTESDDYLWWLMVNGDVNAARLLLAVMDDEGWKDEVPRMLLGLLDRQRRGAWLTTTANLWGSLAVEHFSAAFERDPVRGKSIAAIVSAASQPLEIEWSGEERGIRALGRLPWAKDGSSAERIELRHEGTGKPWATVLALAAVAPKAPVAAGYRVSKTVEPIEQRTRGGWSKGDLARVTLTVEADADMTWVVVADPIPAGSTVLGSGLGRDSRIATRGEERSGRGWRAYVERTFEAFRAYYALLPRGKLSLQYTLRINNPGSFALPPTRVEAMYAPEMFGELPNARWEVAR